MTPRCAALHQRRSEVPPAYRQTAQVVVSEQTRRAPAAESTEAFAAAVRREEAEPVRTATVVHDWPAAAEVYLAGLERGLQLGRAMRGGGDVNISGPLAVASSTGAVSPFAYWAPTAYPLVTTSFDRGRSRHRTLRMLLQDQFAIDQEGPYVFDEELRAAPLGVGLNPFLPRGLPADSRAICASSRGTTARFAIAARRRPIPGS
jgi:hypothetical protein